MLPAGAWTHEFVHAHGSRFHLAAHCSARPVDPRSGARTPVLLLPEVGRTWWSWRYLLPRLGRDVRALDPRGVGASDRPPTGYRPADVVDDLLAVLDELGGRPVLIGHGWGGLTATWLAAIAPDRIAGLVRVASPLPGAGQGYTRLVRTARLGARVLTPDRVHRLTGADHLDRTAPCRVALREWPGPQRTLAPLRLVDARLMRRRSDAFTLSLQDARTRRPSVPTDLPPTLPVLDVRASHDRLLPDPRAGAPDAVVLPGGHHLPEQRPAALAAVLLPWLDALGDRAAGPTPPMDVGPDIGGSASGPTP